MKYCEHCGARLEGKVEYCPNCGAKVNGGKEVVVGTVVDNSNNTTVKDNTTTGFVLSIIGFLCCTYVAIPGLIISIMSLKNMNEGKISSEKKWMAIFGIVLSVLGIAFLIYNLMYPERNQQIVEEIMKKIQNEFLFK